MKLLVIAPTLAENSLGRAYVWWLLCQELGWSFSLVSAHGEAIWQPVRGTHFAAACARLGHRTRTGRAREVAALAADFDAVVAVKPLPQSLGLALHARKRAYFPLIIDIDDPDLEVRTDGAPLLRRLAWKIVHSAILRTVSDSQHSNGDTVITVSNPVLQERYGGVLIPHARAIPAQRATDVARENSRELRVAFIGTVRAHKGISILRQAVAELHHEGVSLTITSPAPPDAAAWEHWIGETTLERGAALLAESDVVVLPSLDSQFARGQLPAKLIDGMAAGKVVIASHIDPLPWALGDAGLTVNPGSVSDLSHALRAAMDPQFRERVGRALHARAEALMSVHAVAPAAAEAVRQARTRARAESPGTPHG